MKLMKSILKSFLYTLQIHLQLLKDVWDGISGGILFIIELTATLLVFLVAIIVSAVIAMFVVNGIYVLLKYLTA